MAGLDKLEESPSSDLFPLDDKSAFLLWSGVSLQINRKRMKEALSIFQKLDRTLSAQHHSQ